MSQQNVDVVRQALQAMDKGLDRVAEFWDPDIDWRAIEGAPDDIGVFKGRAALRRYYEQWYETFDELRGEPRELIDAGDGRVVVAMSVTDRMKGSEAEVRDQALEAAGLSQ
jgi:ketosteroid isomerase-like protein